MRGTADGRRFRIPTPVTQHKHATNLPSPIHRPSGTTDVISCNFKSPSTSSRKFLHYTQRDHAPEVHGQYQVVVLHRECLQQRGKCDHSGVSENLGSPPSEEWSLNERTGNRNPQGIWGRKLRKSLTENSSVRPNNLSKRADNVTERVNAMLPSPVF